MTRRHRGWIPALVLALAPRPAAAEEPLEALEVERVARGPVVDGELDDPAWRRARFVSGFAQRSPTPFAEAPARTGVAAVHDAGTLYVAFRCAGEPATALSARDELPPEADYVLVYLDGALDRRSARFFGVTAAGVQIDGTLAFDSPERDHSWDAVFRSAVSRRAGGWTVEIAIPLGLVGLAETGDPRVGIHFRRYFGAGAVVVERDPVPHTSSTYVSHFEVVGPLRDVRSGRAFEVRPFLRLDLRPRVAEGAAMRRAVAEAGAGVELRVGLRSDLGLHVAVLPDFGEAELDPAVLNLSAYETLYPEGRQLFLESADLFRLPALTTSTTLQPFQLVHTRRIGASPERPDLAEGEALVEMDEVAPVEGVARLAGQVREGTEVGVLAALAGPATAVVRGSDGASRNVAAAERQYFAAARLRQRLGRSGVTLGGMATATGGLAGGGDQALAVDVDYRAPDGHHRVIGIAAASLSGGSLGWAAHLSAGRMGGEGVRWRLVAFAASDGFDVNRFGWQRRADRFGANGSVGWVFDGLTEPLRTVWVSLYAQAFGNFGGLLTDSGQGLYVQLGQWERDALCLDLWLSNPAWDDLETRGGPPIARPTDLWGQASFRTALDRPFGVTLSVSGSGSEHGDQLVASGELRWSPLRVLRLTLAGSYGRVWNALLWVDDVAGDNGRRTPLLGRLDLDLLDLSLGSTLALTSTLSLTARVQLLATAGAYGQPSTVDGDRTLPLAAEIAGHDFADVVLLANLVARWEPRPGLALYGVYTHAGAGEAPPGVLHLAPALSDAAWASGSDVVLLKLELSLS